MKKMLMMAAACLMAAMAFAAQCAATTKKGTQCKRQASPGSEFCWQHGGTTKAERGEGWTAPSPECATRRSGSYEVETDDVPVARPSRRKVPKVGGEDADAVDSPAAKPSRHKVRKADSEGMTAPGAEPGMCAATTKAGTPCKRKAVAGGRYCAQHAANRGEAVNEAPVARPSRRRRAVNGRDARSPSEGGDGQDARSPSTPRAKNAKAAKSETPSAAGGTCQGKSKNGEPCRRKAKPGSSFCWQHEK